MFHHIKFFLGCFAQFAFSFEAQGILIAGQIRTITAQIDRRVDMRVNGCMKGTKALCFPLLDAYVCEAEIEFEP